MARSKFRSVRYDLAAAIDVARLAGSAGGAIGPDILAPALGYSGTNNGAYLSRVASARMFGLVTGRGPRVELTERGRLILAGVEPGSTDSRREAFLAVPLFRAVADATEPSAGMLPEDLARWLVDDFGETEAKAQSVADQLIASAGQAGIIRRTEAGKVQFTSSQANFTSVDKYPSVFRGPQVTLRRGAHSSRGEDVTMAENGLWLDEENDGGGRRPPVWRRAGVVAGAAVILIVVAVPVALVAGGSSVRPAAVHNPTKHPQVGNGPAKHEVLSALSATTDSGSFDFSYAITSAPASSTAPTTTSTSVCHQFKVLYPTGAAAASGGFSNVPTTGTYSPIPVHQTSSGGSVSGGGAYSSGVVISPSTGATSGPFSNGTGTLPPGFKWKTENVCNGLTPMTNPGVSGHGTINTSPLGMVASANIGSGLDVSVRVSSSVVYEGGSGDTGLASAASGMASGGTSLPGFASLTEGALGSREGAVAMMGMASPTGYLDLVQPAIGATSQTGTGTVDGVSVTNYQVSNDLSQLAGSAGMSSAESQAITDALTVLKGQGYTTNTAAVSIDGVGFIRQVKSVDTFADGGTVTLLANFSNFGCAGTVLMPGQTGSGLPPSGCTSPDGPNSSTTTTTTSSLPSTPTTSGSGITTVPGSTSTTSSTVTTTTSTTASLPASSTTTTTKPPSTSTSGP